MFICRERYFDTVEPKEPEEPNTNAVFLSRDETVAWKERCELLRTSMGAQVHLAAIRNSGAIVLVDIIFACLL